MGNVYDNNQQPPHFWCELCECQIPGSFDETIAMKNLTTHIYGNQHQNLLSSNKLDEPEHMICMLCNSYIQMSYSNSSTLHGLKSHLSGNEHQNNVQGDEEQTDSSEESEESEDGSYEYYETDSDDESDYEDNAYGYNQGYQNVQQVRNQSGYFGGNNTFQNPNIAQNSRLQNNGHSSTNFQSAGCNRASRNNQPKHSECVICFDTETHNAYYKLICGHEFHEPCILKWFQQMENCPVCRINVRVG